MLAQTALMALMGLATASDLAEPGVSPFERNIFAREECHNACNGSPELALPGQYVCRDGRNIFAPFCCRDGYVRVDHYPMQLPCEIGGPNDAACRHTVLKTLPSLFGCLKTHAFEFDDCQEKNWNIIEGAFEASPDELKATRPVGKVILFDQPRPDMIMEGTIEPKAQNSDVGFFFRAQHIEPGLDGFDGYFAGINPNAGVVLGCMDGSWRHIDFKPLPHNQPSYHLRVEASGDSIKVFVNKELMIDARDNAFTSGIYGLRVRDNEAAFKNVKVWPNLLGSS